MQWHRHDYVEMKSAKTFIVKRCAKPARYEMSQVNLTAVLKIMNNLTDDAATAVRGHRCIKVNCAVGTVRTGKSGRNSALEGLRALPTKRRNYSCGLRFALLTEIFARSSLAVTERAYRGVKKRRSGFEQFNFAKRDHISPKCALLPR
jgi:hypothetical protein